MNYSNFFDDLKEIVGLKKDIELAMFIGISKSFLSELRHDKKCMSIALFKKILFKFERKERHMLCQKYILRY